MSELIERAKKLLTECGIHDYGLAGFQCGCSGLDHRPIVSELLDKLDEQQTTLEWAAETIKRLKAECAEYDEANTDLGRALERAKPILGAARAWRGWFPYADSMFAPENALIAAVDALDACSICGPGGCAGHTKVVAKEPDLIIYQAWDSDELGWDDNGMSGTDAEAVKLGALESFVEWCIEENWCGDPDELDRFENELREGLHWRQIGKVWELHQGAQAKQGRSTWQGINVYATKVGRDTVAEMQTKCDRARAARLAAEGLSSADTTAKPLAAEDPPPCPKCKDEGEVWDQGRGNGDYFRIACPACCMAADGSGKKAANTNG